MKKNNELFAEKNFMIQEEHKHQQIEMRSREIQSALRMLKQWDRVLKDDMLETVCDELDIIITKHLSKIESLIDEGISLELNEGKA